MKKRTPFIATLLLYGITLTALVIPSTPSASVDDASLLIMRAKYIQAEKMLNSGRTTQFHKLSTELQDYPLLPYLEYKALRKRLSKTSHETISEFLKKVDNSPLENQMRHAWLKSMAKQGRWKAYLQAYQPTRSTALKCYHRIALLKNDYNEEAFDNIESLWLTGKSQPRACDPLFKAWKDANLLSHELIWQRFHMAMDKRNLRLARYLKKLLSESEQQWAGLWIKVHYNPTLILNNKKLSTYHPMRHTIIKHGIKRMARKNASAAATLWKQTLSAQYQFNEKERTDIIRYIATHLASQGREEAFQWLVDLDPEIVNENISQWRIRTALSQQNWEATLTWIHQLPEDEQQNTRWKYWQARALEGLGQKQYAEELYLELAQHRTYYGFLSADRLELPYHFTNRPLEVNSENFSINDIPGLLRARELLQIGQVVDARREWYFATRSMTEKQLHWAAKLAHDWNWHDRAIVTVARTSHRDDLALRFPLAHYDKIVSESQRLNLNPAHAYAVIRQESAFIADARSSAGALGLMQILPSTARQHARALGIRINNHKMIDVRTNLRLGMRHLKKVLTEFGDHPVLASAAYNAGEYAVKRWLPENGSVESDIWTETIPYKETREYAKNILTYTAIYEQRLGQGAITLSEKMTPILSSSKNQRLAAAQLLIAK